MKSAVLLVHIILVLAFFGCRSYQADADKQASLLDTLHKGSFGEAKHAGEQLLEQTDELRYGTSLQSATSILGKPDLELTDKQTLDVYWKTAGGPLWLCYYEGKLIKRAMIHPAHWDRTDKEMAERWQKVRNTKDWPRF
jgi:hypothetical protein